ncbi:11-beta-hydroxysteroid dehydrogenase A-like [Bidens hawaiensis]|uniref:11-beta-hydroxysteroid dehydrogenase A-like n=1 Tax=Bidens hawaiensis TaxID=980011 RepID=UPI0040497C6E
MFFKFFLRVFRVVFSENVAGKVVLITGASSGIGEHLAYEYASRGACLALSARREERLREVADRCRHIGSPEVIIICADVSNAHDCKQMIDQTVHHFNGRCTQPLPIYHAFECCFLILISDILLLIDCMHAVDHLVNNAGISQIGMLEEADDITNLRPVIDINFWGSVYVTKFAAPHLRHCGGRIIALSSAASWLPLPRMNVYNVMFFLI